MKTLSLLSIALIILTQWAHAQKLGPGKVIGVWINEDTTLKICIYKAGPKYFGRQIWGSCLYESDGKTSKKDIHNTIGRLRKRNLKDLIILTNFNYEGRVYDGGNLYDFESGKSYNSSLKLIGENKLLVRRYSVFSFFGKTTTWIRVQ